MEHPTIVAAFFAFGGTIITAIASVIAARQATKAKRQVATSNGHNAGQLLEVMNGKLDATLHMLGEHTADDEKRFGIIERKLDEIEADVSGK